MTINNFCNSLLWLLNIFVILCHVKHSKKVVKVNRLYNNNLCWDKLAYKDSSSYLFNRCLWLFDWWQKKNLVVSVVDHASSSSSFITFCNSLASVGAGSVAGIRSNLSSAFSSVHLLIKWRRFSWSILEYLWKINRHNMF